MRPDGQRRRVFMGAIGCLGARFVTGSVSGRKRSSGERPAVVGSGTDALQSSCTPGHDGGDPACTQIQADAEVFTPFNALDTDLVTRFSYPCGWVVGTTTYDDRIQANASRSNIGDVDASVDIQVRNYTEPVDQGFLDAKRKDGNYIDMEYTYAGQTRIGLVSSPETAEFGTLAHAVVPTLDEMEFRHVEFISTMHGGECAAPRPDYWLVRKMLASIEPNREPATVTFEDQAVSSEVETQSVTIASATVPNGGYVVVHTTPIQQNDLAASVIGASSYLSSGGHQNIRIALETTISDTTELVAIPHRDTDGDNVYEFGAPNFPGDGPYTAGTGPVTDRASVTALTDTPVPSESNTPTPTLEPLETSTLSATPVPSSTTDPPSTTSSDGTPGTTGPGFGVVGTLSGIALGSTVWIRRYLGDSDQ